MTDSSNLPVLVGIAQLEQRDADPARGIGSEPLQLMIDAAWSLPGRYAMVYSYALKVSTHRYSCDAAIAGNPLDSLRRYRNS